MDSLMSGLIGAVIAVFCSYWLQEYAKRRESQRSVNALLLAIKTEIKTLEERFNETGCRKKTNGIYPYVPIEQNYFLVLEGQSFLLGAIKNEKLRELIIKAYIHAKSLIDTYKLNNKYHDSNDYKKLNQYAREIEELIKKTENNVKELTDLINCYLKYNSFTCLKCRRQIIT